MEITAENIKPKIGDGIYSTQDVADILNLPYHSVRHVMGGFWRDYAFGEKGDLAVNFLTMIEFYTYYQLRQKGVKAKTIKRAHTVIAQQFNTNYPFAMDNIHTDGKTIWYEVLELIINADGSEQLNIEPLIRPFISRIEFGNNNLAERYYPLQNSHNIVVDPKYQLGQPVIEGTRIKAEIINDFYQSGESINLICSMYNLTEDQVEDVIKYYKNVA